MKFAIVTGGSRGLGKGVVDALRDSGWKVLELSRSGNGANHITVDMSVPSLFIEQFEAILEEIDSDSLEEVLLVSNAGTLTPIAKVPGMSSEEMEVSFNVNITSALMMIHCFVSYFRKFTGKKSVISISSGAATKGYPGWSLYCAGKAACENYMRTLFMEEASEDQPFRIISFNPGVIDTDMQGEIRQADPGQFPMQERFINLKKNGELLEPRFVAAKLIAVVNNYDSGRFIYSVHD